MSSAILSPVSLLLVLLSLTATGKVAGNVLSMARPSCWGGTGSCGNLTNIGREGVVVGAWLERREGVAEGA